MRNLLLLLAILPLGGCFETHVRDEATIRSVERTIEAREHDYAFWKAELAKPVSSERDLKGLQALQDSELDRLRQSKAYEESKK